MKTSNTWGQWWDHLIPIRLDIISKSMLPIKWRHAMGNAFTEDEHCRYGKVTWEVWWKMLLQSSGKLAVDVTEVKMCNSKVADLSFIIRMSFQRTDSLKWFNRAQNSILRVCLLISQNAFWKENTEDVEQAQKMTKEPNENSSGQIHTRSGKHFNTLPFFKRPRSEKRQVLYLQNGWKSHCNNQWVQSRGLRFPLFPPWFHIKVKKDPFVQNPRRM